MSKSKQLQKETKDTYFKEIISFIIVVLCIIILSKIGILGFYGMLIFKILFGEWSFIIIIIILISQIYYLIKKKSINFQSIRFQGFIFLYLSISLICHLSIYEELGLTSKNIFTQTLKLYKSYFKSYESSYYVGGGILGLILFQITILILGNIGITLISISLMILGISNLCNHSLVDFIKHILYYGSFLKTFKTKLINILSKIANPNDNRTRVIRKNPTINLLNDVKESPNKILEEHIKEENYNKIKEYLIKNDPTSSLNDIYLGHIFSSISFTNLSMNSIKYIGKILNTNLIFKYGNNIYIDYTNHFKDLYTLKQALLKTDIKNIPIGLMPNNDVIILDEHNQNSYLVIGNKGYGIKNFCLCIISSLILIYKENISIHVFDLKAEYKSYFPINGFIKYKNNISSIQNTIDEIIEEYDKRQEILNYLNQDDYFKCNNYIKEENKNIKLLKPIYLFINISLSSLKSDSLNKISFLISQGLKCGIYIFIITREGRDLDMIAINQLDKILFKTTDLSVSLKLTKSDIATQLDSKGEILYIEKEHIRHAETPFISISDFMKIINKITF